VLPRPTIKAAAPGADYPAMTRVILSCKGFDSKAGGGASPILPDGRMLSLPIPDPTDEICFRDLRVDDRSLLDVMRELGFTAYDDRSRCHLDPDINRMLCARPARWRGLFGQIGPALGHLQNEGVGAGDLFIFWGRFRHTTQTRHGLRFDGAPFHAIYGYLEVGRVLDCGAGERVEWAPRYPHFGSNRAGQRGGVFVAASRFEDTRLAGSGVFIYSDALRLSDPAASLASTWRLPAAFHPNAGTRLTYHEDPRRWSQPVNGMAHLRTVARGQEFVTKANPAISRWARQLISTST
jgi:Nucleotide modification associated domain 3